MKSSLRISYFVILLAMLLLGSFLLANARMKSFEIGYKIAKLNAEKERLQQEHRRLKAEIARKESLFALLKKNEELSLSLVPIEDWLELPKYK